MGVSYRAATWTATLAMALLLSAARPGSAQQLEPRAYSPSPVGANFVGVGYAHSSGNVLSTPPCR